MYAINVLLFLAASLLALFTFIFVGGAAVHVVSLLAAALRAVRTRGSVKASLPRPSAAPQPAIAPIARRGQRQGAMPAVLDNLLGTRNSALARAGWLKTAAAVVGLAAVGFAAILAAGESASALHAMAVPAAQSVVGTQGVAGAAPAQLPSSEARVAPAPIDNALAPVTAPRECAPSQGIVRECTYN